MTLNCHFAFTFKAKVELCISEALCDSLNSMKMKRTIMYHFGFAFTSEGQLCRSLPKKTPASSQVLNELAEGIVRRTGGRLALAFRIFLRNSRGKCFISSVISLGSYFLENIFISWRACSISTIQKVTRCVFGLFSQKKLQFSGSN